MVAPNPRVETDRLRRPLTRSNVSRTIEMTKNDNSSRVRITRDNLEDWPQLEELFRKGEVRFDKTGKLRYLHGAPVGDMILVRIDRDGRPIYKESAEGWFDSDSPAAMNFEWP